MNPADDKHRQPPTSFEHVHRDERARLNLSSDLNQLDGVGLALSGGGIRSASFALGVVQELLNEELFPKIDYLSTVSGGGYLGSTLSWWLHQAATDPALAAAPDGLTRFQAFRRQFGSKAVGARTQKGSSPWSRGNWLSYIRQHGNYLQPRGVGYASLAASVLRVCLYPLCVYGLALFGLFCLDIGIETKVQAFWGLERLSFLFAALATILLVALSWIYGPATWLTSLLSTRPSVTTWLYSQRTRFRNYSGLLLSLAIAGWLSGWLAQASLSFLSLGSLGTLYQFFQGRAQSRTPSWFTSIRLIVTAALVIYGLLLGAYLAGQPSTYRTVSRGAASRWRSPRCSAAS